VSDDRNIVESEKRAREYLSRIASGRQQLEKERALHNQKRRAKAAKRLRRKRWLNSGGGKRG
jgi:hypothetical protein